MESIAGYQIIEAMDGGDRAEGYRVRAAGGEELLMRVFRRADLTGEAAHRIQRDVDQLTRLECARIVPVVAAGVEGEDIWYVARPPGQRTLAAELDERLGDPARPLSLEEVLRLAIGLGEALGYLHERGMVYGDLAGENILLVPVLGPVLREAFPGANTGKAADAQASSLKYASPEQVQLEQVQATSDVYQAGLVLYHALTGRLPLEDENPFQTVLRRMQEDMPPPSRFRAEVKEELDTILLRCLKPRAEDRYPDMNAFLEDVLRLDPVSGQLLPGEAIEGETRDNIDPMMGLIIPSEKPTSAREDFSVVSAVLPGLVLGVLVVAALLFFLQ